LLAGTDNGFSGPAIQISVSLGETSGRFEVARVIARVFPQQQSFVRELIEAHDGLLSDSNVVYGPYKTDKLVHLDRNTVEFQTPANTDGLGTMSRLRKNGQPITGAIILTGDTPDAVHLSIRLNQIRLPLLLTSSKGWRLKYDRHNRVSFVGGDTRALQLPS